MDKLDFTLLKEIALMDSIPTGAYNIRKNGDSAGRFSTANINITNKTFYPSTFFCNFSVYVLICQTQS